MKSKGLLVNSLVFGVLLGLGVITPGSAVYAQSGEQDSDSENVLEEVIVTAMKREESLQEVPQVVNVVTGETLKDLEIRSFQDLATTVAGLSLSRVSGGEQSASMRGIKMSNPGGASSATNTVEMYVNEVPITAVDSFNAMFDIGQVEVLRGPQGTLRGRPSPSGAITITTRKGSYTDSDGYIQAGASDNGGLNGQAAWGGPLSDTFAVRFAGIYDESDDNGFRSLGNGKHSYHETTGLRASLGWRPTGNFELDLMYQYIKQDQDFYRGIEGTVVFPPTSIALGETFVFEDRISLNQENPNSYEADLITLTANYDWDKYALHYVGGYKDASFMYQLDFDFAGDGMSPWLVIDDDNEAWSNELRFESTSGEIYNFTLGVFTSKNDHTGGFGFLPFAPVSYTPYSFEDLGYFMNNRFDLGVNDSINVGLRRSEYKVDRLGAGPNVKYSATTGNASYQHNFSDTLMAYVGFGKSFRPGSGGANTTGTNPIPQEYANYDEEKSTSWEIGLKSQFLDNRLRLNMAYYDQKYDGFIGVTNNVACTGVPNPDGLGYATTDGLPGAIDGSNLCRQNVSHNGDAVASGVEIELTVLITDDWMLGLNYSYVDSHYDNALIPCNDYNGDGLPDNEGDARIQQGMYVSECRTNAELGQIPPHSFSAYTQYDFNVGSMGAYIRANMIYNDKSYFPQTGQYLPSDTRVNTFLGVRTPDEKWEFSVWAKNVFDKTVMDNDGGTWNVAGIYTGLNVGTITYGRELGVTLRRDFF